MRTNSGWTLKMVAILLVVALIDLAAIAGYCWNLIR
jgi:hypothetical protein